LGGPATAKGSAQKPTGGQIFQASHAAPKLGRHIRLVTRNKVVGSLGPDGRLKFIWTPPKRKTVFGVMIDRLRLQFYIRPLMQTEACGP
jgi:hypothetical protein